MATLLIFFYNPPQTGHNFQAFHHHQDKNDVFLLNFMIRVLVETVLPFWAKVLLIRHKVPSPPPAAHQYSVHNRCACVYAGVILRTNARS